MPLSACMIAVKLGLSPGLSAHAALMSAAKGAGQEGGMDGRAHCTPTMKITCRQECEQLQDTSGFILALV